MPSEAGTSFDLRFLQGDLPQNTHRMLEELMGIFARHGIPIEVVRFDLAKHMADLAYVKGELAKVPDGYAVRLTVPMVGRPADGDWMAQAQAMTADIARHLELDPERVMLDSLLAVKIAPPNKLLLRTWFADAHKPPKTYNLLHPKGRKRFNREGPGVLLEFLNKYPHGPGVHRFVTVNIAPRQSMKPE